MFQRSATASQRRAPRTALLWAALLLVAQTVVVVHAHADAPPEAPCAVCPLAQAQTAACDAVVGPLPAAASPRTARPAETRAIAPAAALSAYRSRAPPLA